MKMESIKHKDLEYLKELVYASDNRACFIERERILGEVDENAKGYKGAGYYALILEDLLARVSTPIDEKDVFGGRVVEALPDEGMKAPSFVLWSPGHMTLDWRRLLSKGLKGIIEDIEASAQRMGDEVSLAFAKSSRICADAVAGFALRYSKAALRLAETLGGENRKNILRMAKALEIVPFRPAYDFFSALQSIWFIQMINSCYIGERDFAFGRMDQYLYHYYEKDISNDVLSREEAVYLLAHFLIKPNEICGRATHNYNTKPIPPQSSKQYIIIGGCDASGNSQSNDLSLDILEAKQMTDMAEPIITVRLDPDGDGRFTEKVFQTMHCVKDKMHVFNDRLIYNMLVKKGVQADIAADYTFSACCTLELNHRTLRYDKFESTAFWLCEVLGLAGSRTQNTHYENIEQILEELYKTASEHLQGTIQAFVEHTDWPDLYTEKMHFFTSMLRGSYAERCRYPYHGGDDYHLINIYLSGLATIADSLAVLDKLVFIDKRFTYSEFMRIVTDNFSGHEALLMEIKNTILKFGNDTEADRYAVMAADALLNAVDKLRLPQGYLVTAGFYSLDHHTFFGSELPATPDGRLACQPISENQSPVYGCDIKGTTALLKSLSKLPFYRTGNGGLNLTFALDLPAGMLQDIICTYFKLGGIHAGISVVNKQMLEDAMVNPDRYKSLTVRLYGFSEYFISLSKEQQLEILNRTANTLPE